VPPKLLKPGKSEDSMMKNRWPPRLDEDSSRAQDSAALAAERAILLARYWNDNDSDECNLSVVDWWLEQARQDNPPA
jgi:hypothetical protein